MARRDQPTPRYLDRDGNGRDEPGGPDLPLNSIPSVPEQDSTEVENRGAASHIIVGAALFILIVAISVLGARYLKLPRSPLAVAPPEEQQVSGQVAAAAVEPMPHPAAESEPAVAPVLSQTHPAEPAAERAAADESQLAALRSDLAKKTKMLADARRELDSERELRRLAERKAEEAPRAARARSARDEETLDRKGRTRLKALEKESASLRNETAALRKEAAEARKALEAAQAMVAGREAGAAEAQARAGAAEKRARTAEAQLQEIRGSHDRALQGESEAVRKLVADLNTARDAVASEKAARAEAERRSRSLDAELQRLRAGGNPGSGAMASEGTGRSAPSSAARTAPAAPPPAPRPKPEAARSAATRNAAASDVREPERVRTQPPYYPEELRRARVGGRVLLRLLVDESGRVADVQVTESPHPRLGELAASAARRWTYTPGRREGIRASVWITEAVDFKL